MQRRDFINKAAIAAISIKSIVISSSQARAMGFNDFIASNTNLKEMDVSLIEPMKTLLDWIKPNGWTDLIKKISGIELNSNDPLNPDLFKKFNANLSHIGCDDFIGTQLITPGLPQESLLYHLFANPRVRLATDAPAKAYPSLAQIDLLENFIYSFLPITPGVINTKDMVLAVFAYEYRPACKTPHDYHADLVFSRTGFSRIGTQEMSEYDRINRCFTNLPKDVALEKEIAVTPARYGLFLAKRLNAAGIENNAPQKKDEFQEFLLPIRKIYKDDPLISGFQLFFEESHLNEKLYRICTNKQIKLPSVVNFNLSKAPFIRVSNSSTDANRTSTIEADKEMVNLKEIGSSVLLSSFPRLLVWRSYQTITKPERIRIKIPSKVSNEVYSNRRYTTLKLISKKNQYKDAFDIARNYIIARHKIITDYHAPRNEPMFVNIREVVTEADGDNITHLTEVMPNLIIETNKSNWVGLFEDNICDGCVTAVIKIKPQENNNFKIKPVTSALLKLKILPAFSIVTAPDFFPLVESWDMKDYDDLFLSGGIQDMSGGRLKANPLIKLPFQEKSAFPSNSQSETENRVEHTILAILTGPHHSKGKNPGLNVRTAEAESQTRTNFLPDSATLIFYPGWDATYSNTINQNGIQTDLFYSTMGLGSPFVEDSKLCAAANGMWAAASPDSARTFRPTLTPIPLNGLPPTSVPLLDLELGYNPESSAVKAYGKKPTVGWDGEQGPFLIRDNGSYKVNLTDIHRSDYVQNVLNNRFDMSQMRKITIAEIRNRMHCLQKSYAGLGIDKTKIWMIGAEKIDDWNEEIPGLSLPPELIKKDQLLQQAISLGQEPGYLYLFVTSNYNVEKVDGSKRPLQRCKNIYICLVNKSNLKICTFKEANNWTPAWI